MLLCIGLKLAFWNFQPIFLRMQFSVVATFFLYFWLSVWVEIGILNFLRSFWHLYHLTFEDKSVRVLDFHFWKVPGTLEAKWSFQTFNCPFSDSFVPNYKCKVSSAKCYYIINLIFDSIWVVLVLYCKVCAYRIILFFVTYC